jgi:hypothetical protein
MKMTHAEITSISAKQMMITRPARNSPTLATGDHRLASRQAAGELHADIENIRRCDTASTATRLCRRRRHRPETIDDRPRPNVGVGQQQEKKADEDDLIEEFDEPFAEIVAFERHSDRRPGELDPGKNPEQLQRKAGERRLLASGNARIEIDASDRK